MKRACFLLLVVMLCVAVSSCSVDSKSMDVDAYDELRATLSLWADDAEAEAYFSIYDLSVTDADVAISTLRSYANGWNVSKKKVLDSITYLERYISALENEFDYLERLIK